jgi:hypothetical protein
MVGKESKEILAYMSATLPRYASGSAIVEVCELGDGGQLSVKKRNQEIRGCS